MAEKFVRFQAQPGQQSALFECPVQDILFGGARGGGKSHGMLGHFDCHQNEFGKHAKGILFRRTYNELEDIMSKAQDIFCQAGDPNKAAWNVAKRTLSFPSGASLRFRYLDKDRDADHYQGHEYSWICVEEAGHFPSPVPIDKLRACLRSSAGVKKWFLMTANPGGPGHNWLKAQYIDPAQPEQVHTVTNKFVINGEKKEVSWDRVYIPSTVFDNHILLENDPDYINNLVASAGGQDWLLKAWLNGDWDIVAGGMFDDVWDAEKHILPRFRVPPDWEVYRAFDWGSSKPFSVGWWAMATDSAINLRDSFRVFYPGTLIRIGEWYGWNGTPNTGLRLLESEFIAGLFAREELIKEKYNVDRVYDGPADSSIFTVQDGESIADKHEKQGVSWMMAKKGPGSRVHAWQEIRQMLANAKNPMEDRGLFVTEDCLQFRRLVPTIQRDSKNLDDIDTNSEDHICDETGYMARWQRGGIDVVPISGF